MAARKILDIILNYCRERAVVTRCAQISILPLSHFIFRRPAPSRYLLNLRPLLIALFSTRTPNSAELSRLVQPPSPSQYFRQPLAAPDRPTIHFDSCRRSATHFLYLRNLLVFAKCACRGIRYALVYVQECTYGCMYRCYIDAVFWLLALLFSFAFCLVADMT